MISYNKPTVFFSIPEPIVADLDKLGNATLVCDKEDFLSWMSEEQKYKEKEKLYLEFAEQAEELARILKNVYEKATKAEDAKEPVEDCSEKDAGEKIRSSALAQAIYYEFEKEGIKSQEESASMFNGQDFINMLCTLKGLLFRIFYNDKGYWIDNRMCISLGETEELGMVINSPEDLLTELSGHESLEYLPFAYEEVNSQEEVLKKLDAHVEGHILCIGEWKRVSNSILAVLSEGSKEFITEVVIDNLTSPTTLPFSQLKSAFPKVESVNINHIPAMSILNFYNESGMDGIKQITIMNCAASSVKGVNSIPKGIMIKIATSFLSKEDIIELNKTGKFEVCYGAEEIVNSVLSELDTRIIKKKVGEPFNGRELFNELFNCKLQTYPSSLLVRIRRKSEFKWDAVGQSHYAATDIGEHQCLIVCQLRNTDLPAIRKTIRINVE